MREIRVTWSDGSVDHYSMAAGLTDDQMLAYYKVGKSFNVGNGPHDHFEKVTASEILH